MNDMDSEIEECDIQSMTTSITDIADMTNAPAPAPAPDSVTSAASGLLPEPAATWIEKASSCPSFFSAKDLRSYWAVQVPIFFSPERDCDCLNITYDEESIAKILFEPLDMFITGRVDHEAAYEDLKNLDGPPKLCGRLFKNGEPTYSCKDCGFDPTCVLCVDCFKASVHRHHKYRMSMSGGGGYCDCGDGEAWKSGPFCDIHLRGLEESQSAASSQSKLPGRCRGSGQTCDEN